VTLKYYWKQIRHYKACWDYSKWPRS